MAQLVRKTAELSLSGAKREQVEAVFARQKREAAQVATA